MDHQEGGVRDIPPTPNTTLGIRLAAEPALTRRLSLQATMRNGISLAALAGIALPGGVAMAACVAADQTVSGASSTVYSNGAGITITSTGAIDSNLGGGFSGIHASACSVTTLGNDGTVYGLNVGVFVSSPQSIGTLTNTGTIDTGGAGIVNLGTIGTVTNSGTINGRSFGIYTPTH